MTLARRYESGRCNTRPRSSTFPRIYVRSTRAFRAFHGVVSRCRRSYASIMITSYESSQTISQRSFNVFARHSAGIIFRDNDRTTNVFQTNVEVISSGKHGKREDRRKRRKRKRARTNRIQSAWSSVDKAK